MRLNGSVRVTEHSLRQLNQTLRGTHDCSATVITKYNTIHSFFQFILGTNTEYAYVLSSAMNL